MMNVVIADDHPLFRDALANLINKLFNRVEVKQADNFLSLLAILAEDIDWPDCLFLDLNMPGGNAYENIAKLRSDYKDLPIVIITGSESAEDYRLAIQKGANSFLSKSLESNQLEKAVLSSLSINVSADKLKSAVPCDSVLTDNLKQCEKLTQRQQDVYQLICKGDTNKMIANKLELTEGTVKLHVRAILQTLGVKNRTQAVAMYKDGNS